MLVIARMDVLIILYAGSKQSRRQFSAIFEIRCEISWIVPLYEHQSQWREMERNGEKWLSIRVNLILYIPVVASIYFRYVSQGSEKRYNVCVRMYHTLLCTVH